MAIIRPFRALRPVPDKVGAVASVPYDVVDTDEARLLAKGNPISFLHVTRSEIDLPEGTGLYDEIVYEQAGKNFKKLIYEGILLQEETPGIYIYRLAMDNHIQLGIACCCTVNEYDDGTIRKHENTRREKEDDRLKHMISISAHAEPILMAYTGHGSINAIVDRESKGNPLYDFVSSDGIHHTVWRMKNIEEIVRKFKEVPYLYIADGHHRAVGASRVKKEMLKRFPQSTGMEEFNYFLTVLFPAEQLRIFSYNRFIYDLNGLSEKQFLKAVRNRFKIMEDIEVEPSKKGHFGMYLRGKWYELYDQSDDIPQDDPVDSLDLSIFQSKILEPVLGIKDQKKDKRIDFVGGPDSRAKLENLVDSKGGVAFTFYPVNIDELMAAADAGRTMPPKSTWFAPKLRSGLFIHLF